MRRLFALFPFLLLLSGCGANAVSRTAPAATAVATTALAVSQAARQRPKPANPRLILATTTSTVDSGLLDYLLPIFERQTGYQVAPLSLGSGQALATAARGEADVLLVHSPAAEQQFMADGNGINRRLVMHNDFIIVGAANDPARIASEPSATTALQRIANARVPFVSRGDNSGTNALELQLWKQAGITPKEQSWYVESGTGMGQTLQITNQKQGYTISDRATFLAQRQNLQLAILVEKDPALLNIYHVIQTNPDKSNKINVEGAKVFAGWMLDPQTQALIGAFGKDQDGQSLFFPDAGKTDAQVGR